MPLRAEEVRVLIAEDHFAVRQMATLVLREKKVTQVDVATDGQKTKDMIDRALAIGKPYHVVLLDWEMPFITGIEILKHFRMQPNSNNTAFVMITAMSLQSQVLEAVKAGATAYMVKPVSQAAIAKKFDDILVWLDKKIAA